MRLVTRHTGWFAPLACQPGIPLLYTITVNDCCCADLPGGGGRGGGGCMRRQGGVGTQGLGEVRGMTLKSNRTG